MQHPELAEHPEVDYERSTISVRGVAWFVGIFIAFGIASQILLWVIYSGLHRRVGETNVSASALMEETVKTPQPRLQPSPGDDAMPWQDLKAMQVRELEEFRQRGWVDEKSGNVVIPEAVVEQVKGMSSAKSATQESGPSP